MTPGDILTSSGKHPDRAAKWPPTLAMLHDAQVLAQRVTQLLQSYLGHGVGKSDTPEHPIEDEPKVSSGYRPPEINAKTPGAAKNSNHMVCRAVDIEDPDGILAMWCVLNVDLLEHNELWMEDRLHTPGWVHLQSVPPRSNHRIFVP